MENILMDANGKVYEVNEMTPCVDMPSDELEIVQLTQSGTNYNYIRINNVEKMPKYVFLNCYNGTNDYALRNLVIDVKNKSCRFYTSQFGRFVQENLKTLELWESDKILNIVFNSTSRQFQGTCYINLVY